jgi:hypothetical protein
MEGVVSYVVIYMNKLNKPRFGVLAVGTVKIAVFLDVMLCMLEVWCKEKTVLMKPCLCTISLTS